jgi:hypothetical protein
MISLVLGEPAPTTMGKTLTFRGLFLNNINTSVACDFAPHVNLLPNYFFPYQITFCNLIEISIKKYSKLNILPKNL